MVTTRIQEEEGWTPHCQLPNLVGLWKQGQYIATWDELGRDESDIKWCTVMLWLNASFF